MQNSDDRRKKPSNTSRIDLDSLGKIPPQDIDLERHVLGSLLLAPNITKKSLYTLTLDIFYAEDHRVIANAIVSVHKKKIVPDLMTVITELKTTNKIEEAGGVYNVSTLTDHVKGVANIDYHIKLLYELYLRRRVISFTHTIGLNAYDLLIDVFVIIQEAIDGFKSMLPSKALTEGVKQSEAVYHTVESLDAEVLSKGPKMIHTGNPQLDTIMGLERGIVMVAAGGGIGKSTWMTYYLKCMLEMNSDIAILWYVIDHEDAASINRRFMGMDIRRTDKQLRGIGYKMSQIEREALIALQGKYKEFTIEFMERPCSVKDVENRFHIFVDAHPNKQPILVIDNIMRLTEMKSEKHTTAVDDMVANTIADMYKYNADRHPIIFFLHHMNKDQSAKLNLENGMRPTNDNIKGSGRYFDISEIVLLLNRPSAYDMLMNEYKAKEDILGSMFYTDITKNTFGETGLIRWFCHPGYGLYKEIES